MNPDKQNQAIAEACGWQIEEDYDPARGPTWHDPQGRDEDDDGNQIEPPDYVNSLDAMHEIEATLRDNQVSEYDGHLNALVFSGCRTCNWTLRPSDKIWFAKASVRAKAFLLTIKKWEAA